MLTTTTYSEAGGVGKTTLTANMGDSFVRKGFRVLIVDMDPQDGGLSHLLDVDDDRADGEADHIVRHMTDYELGPFDDLVRTTESGIDVIPSHNALTELGEWLDGAAEMAERAATDDEFEYQKHAQLQRVLLDADVPSKYDVLLVDPPATEGPHLYNALYATRNLVIPFEPSGKGQKSIEGLESLVDGFEREIGEDVGALAVVPNRYRDMKDQKKALRRLDEMDYDTPVTIRERRSMFEGCFERRCTAYEFVDEYRDYPPDRERETLARIDELTDHLAAKAGLMVKA